ncbi:hypothetical protein L596_021365 [Steinernema carpocapsae]|uniref:Uncharacterized protein n=1 Tax=Steinernema carpocapsae TaxID=34508 RepID=A0A4U5MII6_STECR|nr:hypothetical protein L596_021365 [Steinernema carpocapsae]
MSVESELTLKPDREMRKAANCKYLLTTAKTSNSALTEQKAELKLYEAGDRFGTRHKHELFHMHNAQTL